eukprot:6488664-Amphidinium_carterae.1
MISSNSCHLLTPGPGKSSHTAPHQEQSVRTSAGIGSTRCEAHTCQAHHARDTPRSVAHNPQSGAHTGQAHRLQHTLERVAQDQALNVGV